ncbi:rCG49538 [Rattus norvegicus]|nr:rCG49538 [Rattus norvegicus]
METKLYS